MYLICGGLCCAWLFLVYLGVAGLIGWFWWFAAGCFGWLLLVRCALWLLWRIVNLVVWVVLLAGLLNFGCDLWV